MTRGTEPLFEADAGGARLAGWPCHPRVRALLTTRIGGVSSGPWAADPAAPGAGGGFNLGAHCGDDPGAVAENRRRLRRHLPGEPRWLRQVHGTDVWCDDRGARETASLGAAPLESGPREPHPREPHPREPEPRETEPRRTEPRATEPRETTPPANEPVADAAVTAKTERVLAVLTADCLPVLLADRAGAVVGIAHAGWRGLAAGVLERAVDALHERAPGAAFDAYLGPAIGPRAFEVGEEVRAAFCDVDAAAATAFVPAGHDGKWLADLYRLARQRLARGGVTRVWGEARCTVSHPGRFYSYRRERTTGRMASLVWLVDDHA